MRKFIFAVVLMLAVIFIQARLAEVNSIISTLKQADWRFLVLGLFVMGLYMLNSSFHFWSVYRAMGMEEKPLHLTLMIGAASFVNAVAPSGGVGGIAVFVAEAKRKGISQGRVAVASAVVVLMDYTSFLLVLGIALTVFFRRSSLSTTEIIASILMVILVGILGSLLYIGMRSATALGNVLARMARWVNRLFWPILHREYIAEYRAHEFAHDASGGLYQLRYRPRSVLLPLVLAFSGKILMLLVFLVSFLAYNVPFSPGTIIAGWSISYLFAVISPTPGGMGIVEGLLPITLVTLNVPLGAATVITLTFRGFTFWLPLLFGMVAFRWLVREEKTREFA
jgi:glycosyltransferase 2 family protein